MSLAYLTPKGQIIRANGIDILSPQNVQYNLTNIRLDADGQLEEFTINNALTTDIENSYIYADNTHYLVDEHRKKGKTGYLKKKYFIELKNNPSKTYYKINKRNEIDSIWFDSHLEYAAEGDVFYIEKVLFDDNLTKYYQYLKQSFKIKNNNGVKYDDYTTYPTNNEPNEQSPNYNKSEIIPVNRLIITNGNFFEEGNFFETNITKIRQSAISPDAKKVLYKKLTLVCFAIYWIRQEVLDIVAIKPIAEIENAVKNGTIFSLNSQQQPIFSEIDRVVGQLLIDWGYKDYISTKEMIPILNNDNFYNGYYEVFSNYQLALDNFYHNLRVKNEQGLFPNNDSESRLKVLKDILPSSAWAILPYSFRRNILDSYISQNSMNGEEETQSLRIIHSFYLVPTEGEEFLNYLLIKRDGIETNFEKLFRLFDDENISQVSPVVGFFAQEKKNRRNFTYVLYEIWKRSKYDFRYIPPNVIPNNDGINPDAYFLTSEGTSYYQPDEDFKYFTTLEFGSVDLPPQYAGNSSGIGLKEFIDTAFYIDKNLQGEKVHITKVITHSFNSVNQNGNYLGLGPDGYQAKEHMYMHLFQPINLINYKPEEDLKHFLPEDPLVPAFVYYYCNEYDRLKDIHAAWGLAIDVTLEIGFFFISGGASIIKDLKYLRYVTKIGRASRISTTSTEAVLILRGKEVGYELFTVTAAMAWSASYYVQTASNDPATKETAEKVGWLFLCLTMLGAGATIYARKQATRAAYKVLGDSNFNSVPQGVKQVVTHLTGADNVALASFKSKLQQSGHTNVYNEVTALGTHNGIDLQRSFYAEFSGATQADLTLLNNTPGSVANWENLFKKAIIDRKDVNVISKQNRVNAIVKYYTQATATDMRVILENDWDFITRWKFLDKVGADDAHFLSYKADTGLVKRWKIFHAEANTTAKFGNLTAGKQIVFLTEHANNFMKFKNNPKLIDYWENFAVTHIVYRSQIESLEGVYHFKIKDPNAYDHYAFFKNRPKSGTTGFKCTGGHTENIVLDGSNAHWVSKYGVKVLDPNYAHTINPTTTSQKMKDYLNGVGNKVYEKINLPDGHFEHKNILFEKNPQPASYNMDQWVLNGKVYDLKAKHTQYKAAWTEEYIIHDMALARMNKQIDNTIPNNPKFETGNHGLNNNQWIETTYQSTLLDGSEVMIKHVNYHRYNLQPPFYDHYSYFELK